MDHTIVVFTRADSTFDLENYISKLNQDPPSSSAESESYHRSHHQRRAQQYAVNNPNSGAYQFLKYDIQERIMAVDNRCKSEYQKKKTREALVELIDVLQTANKGKPFSDKYFDKANQKLVQRTEEEIQARENFKKEELEQWREALRKAEEISDQLSQNHWKNVQQAILMEEQAKEHKKLTADTLSSLDDLRKGFSVLKRILQDASCISLYDLTECGHRQLNNLSKVRLNPANAGLANEIKERIQKARKYFVDNRYDLNSERGKENDVLTKKILEEELKEECKLAFVYAGEVANSAADSRFQEMGLHEMEEERNSRFAKTKIQIKDDITTHILRMEMSLTDYEEKLEKMVKQRVVALTGETLAQLKEKDEKGKVGLLPARNLKYTITPMVVAASSSTKQSLETETTCIVQTINFLTQRQLNTLRQGAVEAQYHSSPHCHQVILRGKISNELRKKYDQCFDAIPKIPTGIDAVKLIETFKSQFADVYALQLLRTLEEDRDKHDDRKRQLKDDKDRINREREDYATKISDMCDILTNVVCRLAPEYAKSLNKDQFEEISANDYNKAAKDLSPKVLAELSKGEENKQLQIETQTYFKHGGKINKAIRIYAKLNHDILMDLAKEGKGICFPLEATVVEERKGEMKICDVKVGDRLLATTGDGTSIFQDVFMLGEWQI